MYSEKQINSKKNRILKLLSENLGIITPVLKKVKVSYTTYKKWITEDNDFSERIEEVENEQFDFVENILFENIKDGDRTSVIFYLKSRGGSRRYVDKQVIEQSVSYTEPLKINLIIPDNKDKKRLE